MITVIIPSDKHFRIYEKDIKDLYNKSQKQMCDSNSFEFVRDNTLFYAFLSDNNLLGCIYYFVDNGKLFLNGFAGKKHHEKNLECLKMTLDWFNTDIYAEAQNRASALCLLKCGFVRIKENLFGFFRHHRS